VFSY
jgi:hypothetical protein